ncbi:hypothetical protein VCR4J2_250542 [Vibrio coralliirubri]|nr:hypothetical protein VCR4J2_250542 [Vibrio coralliirubri]
MVVDVLPRATAVARLLVLTKVRIKQCPKASISARRQQHKNTEQSLTKGVVLDYMASVGYGERAPCMVWRTGRVSTEAS